MENGARHIDWRLSNESALVVDGRPSRPCLASSSAIIPYRRLHGRSAYLGSDAAGHAASSPLVASSKLTRFRSYEFIRCNTALTKLQGPIGTIAARRSSIDFGRRL